MVWCMHMLNWNILNRGWGTGMIDTQTQIVHPYFCNGLIASTKWHNNFLMRSSSTNTSSLRFWITSIPACLGLSSTILKGRGLGMSWEERLFLFGPWLILRLIYTWTRSTVLRPGRKRSSSHLQPYAIWNFGRDIFAGGIHECASRYVYVGHPTFSLCILHWHWRNV